MDCEDKFESNGETKRKKGNPAWRKGGVSPNPGGRPAVVGELQELARIHTSQALMTLVEVMNNSDAPPAARVTAATALLDRGYGKPTQSVESKIEVQSTALAHAEALMELANRARQAKLSQQKLIDITPR